MLRVMIVDDEPIIRTGIKASVDWKALDLMISSEHGNGKDALEAFTRQAADILITDIKMPVMDGLALAREALVLKPDLKVILISSYNDFEYVREGFQLGVFDYILKPAMEPEELTTVLRRCKIKIDQESGGRISMHEATEHSGEESWLARERWLKQSLTEKLLVEQAPDVIVGEYGIVWLELDEQEAIEQDFGFVHKMMLLEKIRQYLYSHKEAGIACILDETQMVWIFPLDRDDGLSLVKGVHLQLQAQLSISLTLGYQTGSGLPEFKEKLRRSKDACRRRFFEGSGKVFDTPLQLKGGVRQDAAELSEADLRKYPDYRQLIRQRIEVWRGGVLPEEAIKYEACRILYAVCVRWEDTTQLIARYDVLRSADTLPDLVRRLYQQIEEAMLWHRENRHHDGSAGKVIDQALEYIHAHITESLTLQQVARYVHVSKNYFCHLFKKHTGMNFIDYVIEIRMNLAKRYLRNHDLKIYEVAELCGFGDVKYFSKLFKRVTGCTPLEYRERQEA
jgi:two-component system response regulator YesN